jgi:hypothetical protein
MSDANHAIENQERFGTRSAAVTRMPDSGSTAFEPQTAPALRRVEAADTPKRVVATGVRASKATDIF